MPPLDYDELLLPIGYSYNKAVQTAVVGDHLLLWDDFEVEIVGIRRIRISSAEFETFCRTRYHSPTKRVIEAWQRNALYEGNNKYAVSTQECLRVTFRPCVQENGEKLRQYYQDRLGH